MNEPPNDPRRYARKELNSVKDVTPEPPKAENDEFVNLNEFGILNEPATPAKKELVKHKLPFPAPDGAHSRGAPSRGFAGSGVPPNIRDIFPFR